MLGVEPICAVLTEHGLRIAPSTYYDHVTAGPTARDVRDAHLIEQIGRVHQQTYGVYGARKVWLVLNGRASTSPLHGRTVDAPGGPARCGPRQGHAHYVADPVAERARDRVGRDFNPTTPDQLWVAGITYVSTGSGWVYAAFVIDAFARRILGWRTGRSMTTHLVLDAS